MGAWGFVKSRWTTLWPLAALLLSATACQTAHCHRSSLPSDSVKTENVSTRTDLGPKPVCVVKANGDPSAARPILLFHEVTGISPECLAFAQRLASNSFTVYIPQLFGADTNISKWATNRRLFSSMFSSRWHTLRRAKTPPALEELRSLPTQISAEHNGKSVGVIGMCLTGSWPLALMGEPPVRIAALCQPTVPFIPCNATRRQDLGLSPDDLERASKRIQKERLTVLAFRFCSDSLSTPDRLRTALELCGSHDLFVGKTICTHDNAWPIDPKAHSVFCSCYSDEPGHPTREAYELLLHKFSSALK